MDHTTIARLTPGEMVYLANPVLLCNDHEKNLILPRSQPVRVFSIHGITAANDYCPTCIFRITVVCQLSSGQIKFSVPPNMIYI